MQKLFITVILFHIISFNISIHAQTITKVYLNPDDKVNQWMSEYDVPAVGIGIVEEGEIRYAKVLGEIEKGIPAPNNTIFNVASITKPVVTIMTLKLVESGQWDLHEPLSNYWVDPDVASDPIHKKLTTFHVLTHQSGFVNWRWNHPTKKLTFDFEPGTKFQYSGEGFEYLRHALENKFGKPIGELAESLIFKPLDMNDTRFGWDESADESRVTILTLKLMETGQWDLHEPLSNYWVDPDVASDPIHKKLTTYHVLNHQSGFVNWRWNHPTKKLTFDFEPGTKFQYSGEGFEYLRHALENKFGKPIGELAESLNFEPLDMNDTRFGWDEPVDESRFAAWHDAEGEKYKRPYKTPISAADDLHTTVEDFCKFGIFVINGAGLSPSLYNDMVKPQSDIKKYRAQGLGWSIIKGLPNDEYAISHGGSDYGVKTLAYFLPKSKRGVVVFTNGDNGFAVINNITENTFDIGNEIYKNMYYRPNLPEIVKVPETLLERYTGRYGQPDGSINLITKKDSVLIISGGRWPKTIFYPEANNKFFRKEFDSQLEFVIDATGVITKMIIYHNGNKYSEAVRLK